MAKKGVEKKKDAGALFIPAGLFIGFGMGFLFSNLVAWMFLGLGLGFLAFAILRLLKN